MGGFPQAAWSFFFNRSDPKLAKKCDHDHDLQKLSILRKRQVLLRMSRGRPGPLGQSDEPLAYKEVHLHKNCEFRFGVGEDQTLRLWLVGGSAEIFGTELILVETSSRKHKRKEKPKYNLTLKNCYEFTNAHVAVYTNEDNGCILAYNGELLYHYSSNQVRANSHHFLILCSISSFHRHP